MPDVFRIADILVEHAVRVHGDEIALIAYYGSYAQGTASPISDLDLFYIPDEGRARTLCSQFIIDGLPYDFWPVSWAMATEIAHADSHRPWAVSASLIAGARVLYRRSAEDLARFEALQAHIAALTRPESRLLMVDKGLRAFRDVLFELEQMRQAAAEEDLAGLRWAAHKLAHGALNSLALVNQTYFSKGWGDFGAQAAALQLKPEGLATTIAALLGAPDAAQAIALGQRLAEGVRAVLRQAQAEVAAPLAAGEVFKDFYFFVFEYTNKVLAACARGEAMKAASDALHLQTEIAQLMNAVERGFWSSDFNLLGEYAAPYRRAGFPDLLEAAWRGDTSALAREVRRLDERMRAWLAGHEVDLGLLGSEDELRRFLERRDAVPRA
jgi:hypothetical protein